MNTVGEPQPARNQPPAISNAEVQRALDAILRDNLRQASLGLAILFGILAVNHQQLPEPARNVMIPLAGVTTLIFLGLYLLLRRYTLPLPWVNPLAGALAALILTNTFAHIYLTSDPLQTTNFVLLVIGLGFLMLSIWWFIGSLVVTVASWIVIVQLSPPDPAWRHFGFTLLSAIFLAIIVHFARVSGLKRQERLILEEERRQESLQTTLATTEATRRGLELTVIVAQSITSILNLDVLLNVIVEQIKKHYGYYYVGIFLLADNDRYIISRAGTGEAGRHLCETGFRLRVGEEGIIGWVAKHRQPAIVNDVTQDDRYVQVNAIPETQAELVLPLEVGGTLLGVLDLQSTQPNAFADEDVAVFRSLAAQVAIAIQNASIYESERARRLLAETLYDIGMALSQTLDRGKILELILNNLNEIVPYDRGSVMLRTGLDLEIVAARGFPPGTNFQTIRISIDRENDLFWHIYNNQEPLLIPDVSEWPSWVYVDDLPRAKSWLGVPLMLADEVIGMLSLARETATPYSEDEATLASAFGGQAAVALENARLYANVTQAYEQLERLDRTKSDFINVAAHELRTPLTTLRGYSQMLLNDPQVQSNVLHHQMVEGIYEGAIRLHEIVNSMLDMARIDSSTLQLHTRPVNLRLLIEKACHTLESIFEEREQTLVVNLPELPLVEADSNELLKVFQNLITNAIKYTPDGGAVTITGRAVPANEERLETAGVEIVVSDTGIGIAPEFQELIFTKFYQTGEVAVHSSSKTKFKGGGPGLGLAIAKGIVEAHGGHLWGESPGYDEQACPGSHFHVLLPLHFSTAAQQE